MTTIYVKSRSKGVRSFTLSLPGTLEHTKVSDLRTEIFKRSSIDISRQRLTTIDRKVLDDVDKNVDYYGIKSGDSVLLKDLGPQISWRTVFLTEYAGPLFIHPLLYFSNPVSDKLYHGPVQHSKMQTLAYTLVMVHFLKREIETVFVHRFSNSTMPILNIFKNSGHYWILSGILIAYPIYGPRSSQNAIKGTIFDDERFLMAMGALWLWAEVSNAIVHLNLRSLRPAGSRKRSIPYGYGFSLVACPNYFFEAVAWTAFTALTGSPFAALFLIVSVGQMAIWAQKKLKNYKKEFGPQWPKGRKAMFPVIF